MEDDGAVQEAIKMKKRICAFASLLSVLFACASGANEHFISPETANRIGGVPALISQEYQIFARMHFDEVEKHKEENLVYSPLDYYVATAIMNAREGQDELSVIDPFVTAFNGLQQQQHEFVALKPALASTVPLEEEAVWELNKHYVSTFEGELPQLKKAVSNHYGRDVAMNNPGEYYFSFLEVKSTLYVPRQYIDEEEFYGKQTKPMTYAGDKADTGFAEDESSFCLDVPFLSFRLRVCLPKEGYSLQDVSGDFLTQELETRRVFFHLPEFDINSSLSLPAPSGHMEQSAKIRVTRYGLEASSFTVHGPTSGSPYDEVECWINRPFYFALLHEGIPLFAGVYNG